MSHLRYKYRTHRVIDGPNDQITPRTSYLDELIEKQVKAAYLTDNLKPQFKSRNSKMKQKIATA